MNSLVTTRLLLRRWKQSDIEPFAAMNMDKEVMEFHANVLTLEQTTNLVHKMESGFERDGLGLWAVELKSTGEFIGYVGLSKPEFPAKFMPCVEVGWRLARKYWGNGYAVEAAKEAVRDGFERLDLTEIVSFTAKVNTRSIKVMENLGMKRDPEDDFLFPYLADGHILRPHVLYRLSKSDFSMSNPI